jgi:hypothetical protein
LFLSPYPFYSVSLRLICSYRQLQHRNVIFPLYVFLPTFTEVNSLVVHFSDVDASKPLPYPFSFPFHKMEVRSKCWYRQLRFWCNGTFSCGTERSYGMGRRRGKRSLRYCIRLNT